MERAFGLCHSTCGFKVTTQLFVWEMRKPFGIKFDSSCALPGVEVAKSPIP